MSSSSFFYFVAYLFTLNVSKLILKSDYAAHVGDPRIVNGISTPVSEYPYIVSVRAWDDIYYTSHSCGGSIINDPTSNTPIILTAAHCLYDTYTLDTDIDLI